MPFGYGSHNCIGMKFAILQTKVCIVSLLTRYKLMTNPKTRFPIKIDPTNSTMSAENGIWLDCKKL